MINLFSKTDDFIKKINLLINKDRCNFLGKRNFRWFAVSTCPTGQVLAGPDMTKSRLLAKFLTFRVEN